jgi:cytochrome b involved in lipid metabolism
VPSGQTKVDVTSLGQITLDQTEISKHSGRGDCWIIVDSKVYDITGYFGNHPAGDAIIVNFCGKEATNAFRLSPHRHSDYATTLLAGYLLGNMGETINQSTAPTPSSSSTTSSAGSPSGSPSVTSSGGSTYTAADVSTHNTAGNCWIIVASNVYNISSYLGSHPAGAAIIVNFCGKESTNAFKYSPHVHSQNATNLLAKYYVGTIGTTTTGSGSIVSPPVGSGVSNTPIIKGDEDDD